ncbi:hypothetical protein Glove_575g15 [Diversispora epigaea]|uniref:Uncharacterized protein n=1 Tax=Diversispora epigaea TaxID=1348612 RepID=A0A397GDC6_9GLOM|nr:hypothetical protein Glove_575g15 [Diversispora epigaea]
MEVSLGQGNILVKIFLTKTTGQCHNVQVGAGFAPLYCTLSILGMLTSDDRHLEVTLTSEIIRVQSNKIRARAIFSYWKRS